MNGSIMQSLCFLRRKSGDRRFLLLQRNSVMTESQNGQDHFLSETPIAPIQATNSDDILSEMIGVENQCNSSEDLAVVAEEIPTGTVFQNGLDHFLQRWLRKFKPMPELKILR